MAVLYLWRLALVQIFCNAVLHGPRVKGCATKRPDVDIARLQPGALMVSQGSVSPAGLSDTRAERPAQPITASRKEMKKRSFIAALAVFSLTGSFAVPVSAQSPHTHQHSFSGADEWAKVFDDPGRDTWQ